MLFLSFLFSLSHIQDYHCANIQYTVTKNIILNLWLFHRSITDECWDYAASRSVRRDQNSCAIATDSWASEKGTCCVPAATTTWQGGECFLFHVFVTQKWYAYKVQNYQSSKAITFDSLLFVLFMRYYLSLFMLTGWGKSQQTAEKIPSPRATEDHKEGAWVRKGR